MIITSDAIENYCRDHTSALPAEFLELVKVTQQKTEAPQMQVGPLEGKFLQLLVKLSQAKRILELGTFTGFSSLAMAQALPADGKIVTCDIDQRHTDVAQTFWDKAGVANKVELCLGPAIETIATLADASFCMIFIDADKINYLNYWNACLAKLKTGGIILVDNVLWSGRVLNPSDESDLAICTLNDFVKNDKRVEQVMLPVRDGLLLARKL